ncbi:LOW QUALITY PROTEIN: olfactory receptor 6M1-like [Varanus komodoensis]|uniref:LOW QUALITY PROTEIN: olfactory receptor 6M1-like n=1 Tax=Varanus komodoensis TaxID=61221 RepID=UPI001CF7B1CD|nr:LOW QUALITY PROTEIN: olfactory receptor 6M1-like [Varanus komodoensis]
MEKPFFFLFLVMYILTLIGNALVILVIQIDQRLHTPMYYFLKNLSWLEIIITTTVTPKMLNLLISKENTIAFFACALQGYIYFVAGSTEVLILATMSVDRYMAICHPLRYKAIMSSRVCLLMVLSCWLCSFFSISASMLLKARLPFCGSNVIDPFFCDSGPLLEMICADTHFLHALDLAVSCFMLLSSVSVTTVSYICIISTVIKMPSNKGQSKAFGTCTFHITVASLYHGSSIFIYIKPVGSSSMEFNKTATVFNTVVTPLLNPIIYSFRNKTVKEVLRDTLETVQRCLQDKC